MIDCCERIARYASKETRETFDSHGMPYDAIIRNIELLGEAARRIPEDVRLATPEIEWRSVIAVRNILIHGYFSIDDDIVWDIVQNKIPAMDRALRALKARHLA